MYIKLQVKTDLKNVRLIQHSKNKKNVVIPCQIEDTKFKENLTSKK